VQASIAVSLLEQAWSRPRISKLPEKSEKRNASFGIGYFWYESFAQAC
jgi:hypothetical protein